MKGMELLMIFSEPLIRLLRIMRYVSSPMFRPFAELHLAHMQAPQIFESPAVIKQLFCLIPDVNRIFLLRSRQIAKAICILNESFLEEKNNKLSNFGALKRHVIYS